MGRDVRETTILFWHVKIETLLDIQTELPHGQVYILSLELCKGGMAADINMGVISIWHETQVR